ncbi:trypsin-1-like [Clavelina lepadiformis]|uniref:trypsin-1-like n=1 Tax=Clavelina lepadiformis TaxID=159417 RepID=UPI0040425210
MTFVYEVVFIVLSFSAVNAKTAIVADQNPAVKSTENHQRVVGGTSASLGELPWQGLAVVGASLCGCSLLTSTWAVTAAHCTAGQYASSITLYFGFTDRSFLSSSNSYSVSEIHDHPSYDSITFQNDISLLRIDGSVSVGGNIQTISIPPTQGVDATTGTDCEISGWGTTSFGGSTSQTLLKATVPIVSNTQCNTWYNTIGHTVYDNQVCAGYESGGTDTCQGDSGGPLACKDSNGAYILEGVTSWGVGCAFAQRPGVYARVSEYVDWINSKTSDSVARRAPGRLILVMLVVTNILLFLF